MHTLMLNYLLYFIGICTFLCFWNYFSPTRSMILEGTVYSLWRNNTLNYILDNSLIIVVICIFFLFLLIFTFIYHYFRIYDNRDNTDTTLGDLVKILDYIANNSFLLLCIYLALCFLIIFLMNYLAYCLMRLIL